MMRINPIATPANDTNYCYHIHTYVESFAQSYGVHIMSYHAISY